ncbi:MAG: sporulation integral membrane protein YtvI [Peptococcaceae bacterium]
MFRYLNLILFFILIFLFYLAWKFILPELIVVLKTLLFILLPFILAVIIVVTIEPVVGLFTARLKLRRPIAVLLAMIIVIGSVGTLLTLIITKLVTELIDLSGSLPRYFGPVQAYITDLVEKGKVFYFRLPPYITEQMPKSIDTLTKWLSDLANAAANFLIQTAAFLPEAVLIIFIMIVAIYYISRDRRQIKNLWLKLIPASWSEKSLEIEKTLWAAFFGYLRAQLILITITAIISIIGFYLIGAKYYLTLGLLVGFFDLVPVLGPAAVYYPWAVWSFINGHIGLGINLLILHAILWAVRHLFEAKVVAASLGLHPLAVLFAMFAGLKIFGVAGLVLGPVLLIVIQAVFKTTQLAKDNKSSLPLDR